MVFDLSKISGIGPYTSKEDIVAPSQSSQATKSRTIYYRDDKAFLIENAHTIEVRCDSKLSEHLKSKYESVMESRYFGRGGIEIVPAGQLTNEEIADLIRLSYNLSI